MAGNSKNENVPFTAVLSQCNDIFAIQNSLIAKLRTQVKKMKSDQDFLCNELKTERIQHVETKSQMDKEHEKCQLIETELGVVKRQLALEKRTFEKAFGVLNNKSFRHSSEPEELVTTITGLEVYCEQLKEELEKRDKQVKSLQMKLVATTTAHKREKEEFEKQLKQKVYLAHVRGKNFNKSLQ